MVENSWWNAAVGIGLGILGITGSAAALRRRRRSAGAAVSSGGGGGGSGGDGRRRRLRYGGEAAAVAIVEEAPDGFVCKRVCTSERMLKRVGSFAKDVTPNSCVTVCGVSDVDACAEACARAVCSTPHHVPNWNDVCMRRCQSECLKSS